MPTPTAYAYTVDDTANDLVDSNRLEHEIVTDAEIAKLLVSLNIAGVHDATASDIVITMDDVLLEDEETALDALVAAHTGVVWPNGSAVPMAVVPGGAEGALQRTSTVYELAATASVDVGDDADYMVFAFCECRADDATSLVKIRLRKNGVNIDFISWRPGDGGSGVGWGSSVFLRRLALDSGTTTVFDLEFASSETGKNVRVQRRRIFLFKVANP